jgi:hypothetical protein
MFPFVCSRLFADGHVERWQWKPPKVFSGFGQAATSEEMPDYTRIQNAMVQADGDSRTPDIDPTQDVRFLLQDAS